MEKDAKIYIAGHRGLVGSALVRRLQKDGYANLVVHTHSELDLLNQQAVNDFFASESPDYVFLAAAKVGGIVANNTFPAQFIYENMQIESNIIESARQYGVKKLLFLGSSCIYPKMAPQPMKEEYLLSGPLEPTNEAYAIAKIAGLKMCRFYNQQYGTKFISVMPTNLYGINDNFHPEHSHVLPALIRKFHEAKMNNIPKVEAWGTGSPMREFLHVDDLAGACVFLMHNYKGDDFLNIGTEEEISIKDLYELVKNIVGYGGEIVWDSSKPDGTPRKLLDVSRLHNLGWHHETDLKEGIRQTYEWYKNQGKFKNTRNEFLDRRV